MSRLALIPAALMLFQLIAPATEPPDAKPDAATASTAENPDQLRQELEALKKAMAALEARLAATEKHAQAPAKSETPAPPSPLVADVKELDQRVSATEREQALDRIKFSGDYRFEAHTIRGNVPAHFDGMQLQNLVVKTMFAMPVLGRPPASINEINNVVNSNWAGYQQFTSGLTFDKLKTAMGGFPPAMQQQLFQMLMPSTFVPAYTDNTDSLFTNRLRLKFDAKIADNMSFTGRLSMYKAFGDSTGVQMFNGQPSSMNIDGTTTSVPNSDQLRVDRAYFSWNNIGDSKLYLSIGRRPSTNGPPMNFRQDEPRGGTPSGGLIDYQFDGITVGYRVLENMVWRLCWGVGYQSGFGNANILRLPADRLKDVHFLGANIDLWESDKTLVQFTYAHAFNVTDGFNGLMTLPNNPVTGEAIGAPVVMRYTPSANLGGFHLAGFNVTRRASAFDLYGSGNVSAMRPNGSTTPFGGLMSDPFETPQDRSGYMILAGARYNFANDERTKLGFEFNHGSKYWFNMANGADDIIAPKTNTRGNVFETYLTHRINDHFILKADFIKYLYDYSGSGWHVGAPKKLDERPILGFPTYDSASMVSLGLITRF
jgi:Protein of unknown function (DUF3373)